MAKTKEKIPDLILGDLKHGQVYRAKKPKMVGIFDPLVDDRQIIYISQFKCLIETLDHGFTPEFTTWCNEPGRFRHINSISDQYKYEELTNLPCRKLEQVWDHIVQYDSPSVKNGKKHPQISAAKFIKWAASNVTENMPKGEWAKSI